MELLLITVYSLCAGGKPNTTTKNRCSNYGSRDSRNFLRNSEPKSMPCMSAGGREKRFFRFGSRKTLPHCHHRLLFSQLFLRPFDHFRGTIVRNDQSLSSFRQPVLCFQRVFGGFCRCARASYTGSYNGGWQRQ